MARIITIIENVAKALYTVWDGMTWWQDSNHQSMMLISMWSNHTQKLSNTCNADYPNDLRRVAQMYLPIPMPEQLLWQNERKANTWIINHHQSNKCNVNNFDNFATVNTCSITFAYLPVKPRLSITDCKSLMPPRAVSSLFILFLTNNIC